MIFLHSHYNIVKEEKTERMGPKQNKIEEIMAKLSSNLLTTTATTIYKLKDPRSSANSKQDKYNESYVQAQSRTAENQEETENFESNQRGKKSYTTYRGKVILIMANLFFQHLESVQACTQKRYEWRAVEIERHLRDTSTTCEVETDPCLDYDSNKLQTHL